MADLPESPSRVDVIRHYLLVGTVQGRGVRPSIAREAKRLQVSGFVRNDPRGVLISAQGNTTRLHAFEEVLNRRFQVQSISCDARGVHEKIGKDFVISESRVGTTLRTYVPRDLAVCNVCMCDVRTEGSSKHQYALTSCTECGPRYSLIAQMPYDRERTSMNAFPLCDRCLREYSDSNERRFHAQTNACASCGPQCYVETNGQRVASGIEAIRVAAEAIRDGKILALKGLGGYQLICNATAEESVRVLRDRKARPAKPLAVMVQSVDQARRYAVVDDQESAQLIGPSNPIVLVLAKPNTELSQRIHPGLRDIGLMLPTTPLHWLLMDAVENPLVVTSGNAHDCPLIFESAEAVTKLSSIADVFLHHNRQILRPIDDSVVRIAAKRTITIRVARGIAPLAIDLKDCPAMLATGAEQQVAPAISTKTGLVLGPHIGNMNSEAARSRFLWQTGELLNLYGQQPDYLVCDAHPDLFTTSWADADPRPTLKVQHHHAHIAAAMLDHRLHRETAVGFAFDGTGYGDDATVWGAETLLTTASHYQRVATLQSFRMPGDETAIKQPWRLAASLISQLQDRKIFEIWLPRLQADIDARQMEFAIRHGTQTTSMGRLFDAVAAIILDVRRCSYEGEAAMMLEAACDWDEAGSYELSIAEGEIRTLQWKSMLHAILADCGTLPAGRVAMKFHRAIAKAILEIAEPYRELPIVLGGGVFQNRVLLELLESMATARRRDLRLPDRIPPGDGGLALGQLVVAAARIHALQTATIAGAKQQCV